MTAPTVLLTLDEAQELLGPSAIALVETVPCPPRRLSRLLAGQDTLRGLPPLARAAVRAHRAALRQVVAAGHGGIIDDELAGALSYAECNWPPLAHARAS